MPPKIYPGLFHNNNIGELIGISICSIVSKDSIILRYLFMFQNDKNTNMILVTPNMIIKELFFIRSATNIHVKKSIVHQINASISHKHIS